MLNKHKGYMKFRKFCVSLHAFLAEIRILIIYFK